jgi:hypothetical protein
VDLGTAIASSFSAGISMYGVLAALGIAGRLEVIDAPTALERPGVIAFALVLFAVEFVVDKLPVVDTVWDTVHAAIRPAGGAVIMGMAPDQDLPLPIAIGLGGVLAFTSHSAKSATRVLVNASPEPVSNVLVSTLEDGLVAGLMALAFANPEIALAITVVLVAVAVVLIVLAWKAAKRLHRRWRGRRGLSPPAAPPPDGAASAGSPPPSGPPPPTG